MADEKAQAAAPAEASAGSGGMGKLVPILTLVNTVAMAAVVAITLIGFQKEKSKQSVSDIQTEEHGGAHGEAGAHGDAHGGGHGAKKEEKKKQTAGDLGKMISLEQFTINLSTPGSVNPKYVRVNIAVEVPNEEVEAEFNRRMPQVRNSVIDLFNSKRPADLVTTEGRDALKEEIQNALNGFMVSGKVKGVYFVNFALSG